MRVMMCNKWVAAWVVVVGMWIAWLKYPVDSHAGKRGKTVTALFIFKGCGSVQVLKERNNERNYEIDHLFRYLNRWSAGWSSSLSTLQRSRPQNSREFSCVLSFLFPVAVPDVLQARSALARRVLETLESRYGTRVVAFIA